MVNIISVIISLNAETTQDALNLSVFPDLFLEQRVLIEYKIIPEKESNKL